MAPHDHEIEIIDLEDNLRDETVQVINRGYSSDQSLPDLPIIAKSKSHFSKSVKEPKTKTSKVLQKASSMSSGCQRIVIDDDILFSSPKVSVRATSTIPCKHDTPGVINILSSSQESEDDRATQVNLQTLKKSQSITLPVGKVDSVSGSIPELSSRLLDKLDTLLDKKRKSFDPSSPKGIHLAKAQETLNNGNASSDQEDSQVTIDDQDLSQKKLKKAPSSKSSMLEKAQKQLERQLAKQTKAQEKERKIAEKRIAQSIAAVNVLKKSKKDSTPEMIVEVCASINKSALHTHITSFMQALGCDCKLEQMPVTGLVKLRRKITAKFESEKGYWVPLANPTVEDEDRSIVILKAQDYLQIIRTSVGLQHHVDSVRRVRPSATILYIIEGLASIVRKSKTMKNRAYQAAVRASGITTEDGVVNRPCLATPSGQLVDEETVEDTLLDLQIQHRCLIVHSTSPADTAEHLSVLVSDISTIPYKNERGRTAQFCTESGQIKTGTDERDTFEKLLQAISRVTPQISQAIASRFENISALYSALAINGTACLKSIPKGHNADGTVSNTTLGVATAQKVFQAFMTDDPFAEA